jgi:adenylate cyclase class 2
MKTEIEAKFLNVNFDEVRAKLTELGAVCEQPMRLMRRVIVEPDFIKERGENSLLRLRDEGDKITLTWKEFRDQSLTGAYERAVTVSDFDETVEILKAAGLDYRSYQESRRETWTLGDVEIVLDEWPWINPYIEIEGPTEASVKKTAEKLGFKWEDAVFGSADVIYKLEYPHLKNRGVIDVKEVRFEDSTPELLGERVAS